MDSRRSARGGVAAQSPRHRPRSRQVTCVAPRHRSDDWVVDDQILLQTAALGFAIGEISCRAQYAPGAWAGGAAASCPTPPASDLGRPPIIPAPTEINGQE